MDRKKVCVLMPVYNGEKTIELALKSLLYQSYTNWECVIVNDGSTDNTKNILDSLTDPRFRVFHLAKNVGRGAARQICLDNAQGDYIAFLDADDFYHQDKLKSQVEAFETYPDIMLVCCDLVIFDELFKPTGKRANQNVNVVKYNFGDILPVALPTSMVKVDRAKLIKYNTSLNASEDLDYFTKYLDGDKYLHIPSLYYYYFVSSRNTPYKKILSYTANEFKRGVSVGKLNRKAAVKICFKSLSKWIIYALSIPFLGENFFLKKRNKPLSETEIKIFNNQYDAINSKKNEKTD